VKKKKKKNPHQHVNPGRNPPSMLNHRVNPLRQPQAYHSPCVWRFCSAGNPAAHSRFFLGPR
jgi:hypothetical protein